MGRVARTRVGARGCLGLLVMAAGLMLAGCSPVALRTYVERLTGFDGAIYVSVSSGTDGARGMKDSPLATIQAGIDRAGVYLTEGIAAGIEVRVAAGTYEVRDSAGDYIKMREGVSLYGGYSPGFSERDPARYTTLIMDTSTTGDDIAAVRAYDGITEATVIDGFTIQGGSTSTPDGWSTALDVERASPTIRNNTILGGSATLSGVTIALDVYDNAAPLVEYNTIVGGNCPAGNYGILIADSSNPVVRHNSVVGGSGSTNHGIFCWNTQGSIQLNTIDGGTGTQTRGINIQGNSLVAIKWNHISGGTSTDNSDGVRINSLMSTELAGNTISGGVSAGDTRGIHGVSDSYCKIYNNTVFGGVVTAGTGDAQGVILNGALGLLVNNVIAGGISDWGNAVMIRNGATISIENNIIFSLGTSGGHCIHEYDNGGPPDSVKNNLLWDLGGTTVLYVTYEDQALDNLADVEALAHASGNWDEDPKLADLDGADEDVTTVQDNDWHLTAGSPKEVRQGGRDGALLGWGFAEDKDRATRTNLTVGPNEGPANAGAEGWSMGAYEQD